MFIPTPGGRGLQRGVLETIREAVKLEKPSVIPDFPGGLPVITLKFAYDEGRMTKRLPMELVTMDLITSNKSTSTCKSWKNSYLISIYGTKPNEKSAEEASILEEELRDVFAAINEFETNPVFEIDGQKYWIEVCICLDMACLTKSLGLKDVWRTRCLFRCPWCEVKKLVKRFEPEKKKRIFLVDYSQLLRVEYH